MREAIELAKKLGIVVTSYGRDVWPETIKGRLFALALECAIQRGRELERDELSKQEPVGEVGIDTAYEDLPFGTKLYAKPTP